MNYSVKPERLNLLYTVRCATNKVIYNNEVKSQYLSENEEELGASNEPQQAGGVRRENEEKVEILSLQFNPQSNLLATGDSNGNVKVHDIFSGLPLPVESAENDKLLSQISKSVTMAVAKTPKSATYNMPISTLKWYPYSQYSSNLLFFAHVNGYVSVLNRFIFFMSFLFILTEECRLSQYII